ncbi:MAG: YciI family protein [Bacteroidota bacterium]|nr:YciI family protein [Mucilaginibacter sp. L294]
MNQYIVTGYDYTDEGALERRMAVRPHHLDGAKELKASGNYVVGGALLNDEGKMIGSVLIVQFETEEELQAWQQREPYITQKIWETVDVKPFKVANVG